MIPYQWPGEYNQLHTLGFDYVTLQPNYAFHPNNDLGLFAKTNDAITAGYVDGTEMELSFWVTCCSGNWLTNLQTYFQQANQYGWYSKQPTVYYHGSDISTMGGSSNSDYRAAYDTIHQYIVSTRQAAQAPGLPNPTNTTTTTTITNTTTTTSVTTPQNPPLPLGSLVANLSTAPAGSVSLIFPDYTGPMHTTAAKCWGFPAQLSDYSAGGYTAGLFLNPQNQVLDTSSGVSQSGDSCGNPTGIGGTIVTLAGPAVNEPVHYYEQVAGITPVYFLWDGTRNNFVVRSTGVRYTVPNAAGNTAPGDDLFLIETFADGPTRLVFTLYGFSWQGTLAAANFLNTYVRNHLSEFTKNWYIYEWKEAAAGPSANSFPDQGDQYTQVANG